MNAETFRQVHECSFRKKPTTKHFENKQNAVLRNQASKNEWTNLCKKKQMQFGQKGTEKHFEKLQNTVSRKNIRTNISKNRKMSFTKKNNDQTF